MQICCSQGTVVYNTLQFLNTNDVEVVFTSLVSPKKNGTPVLFAFQLV